MKGMPLNVLITHIKFCSTKKLSSVYLKSTKPTYPSTQILLNMSALASS